MLAAQQEGCEVQYLLLCNFDTPGRVSVLKDLELATKI